MFGCWVRWSMFLEGLWLGVIWGMEVKPKLTIFFTIKVIASSGQRDSKPLKTLFMNNRKPIASAKPNNSIIRIQDERGLRYHVRNTLTVHEVPINITMVNKLVKIRYRDAISHHRVEIDGILGSLYGSDIPEYRDCDITPIRLVIKSMEGEDATSVAQEIFNFIKGREDGNEGIKEGGCGTGRTGTVSQG